MLARHPWRLLIIAIVAVVVLAGLYLGYLAFRINKDLGAVQQDAQAFRSAVVEGDQAAIDTSLTSLRSDSATARSHTDSRFWSFAGHLPFVGDDARGVRTAADVVDDLSHDGLGELATSATRLKEVVPRKGKIDVAAITALQQPVADGDAAVTAAAHRLATQDASGFVGALKEKYRYLQSELSTAAETLGTADTAVQVLPQMLGQDGPKDYLLIVQNNAEIRATGGLPGSIALIRAEHGKLSMVKQVADTALGRSDTPVLPLTKVEKQLYGNQFGTYFVDANLTPDFPRSSDLWRARWEQVEGGKVDGVLSLDPVTLSYILRGTGPVRAGDVTLTSQNAVKTLLSDVYAKRSATAQNVFFQRVARAVFDKVATSAGDPQKLLQALTQGAREHRLYVHSFDEALQTQLDGSGVAGTFVTEPTKDPQVDVTVNDMTGAKMGYYLRYDVGVTANYCTDGVQGLTGSAQFHSTAPQDAATALSTFVTGGGNYGIDPGDQLDSIRIFGPVGGKISKITVNGKPLDAYRYEQGERPVAMFYAQLKPGQKVDYSWTMTTGKGQTGSTSLRTTPSIEPGDPHGTVATACG